MLQITVPPLELYDEVHNLFIYTKEQKLSLEHSLVSLSKWESKWCKPFITKEGRTREESVDYIRCMTLTQNVDPNVYLAITDENINQVAEYIDRPMTATWFSEDKTKTPSREVVTAELVYYWMITYNIPFECQKWHLNRLLTLIRVCNVKNSPPKKMSQRDIMSRNAALNAERRRMMKSKG